MKFTFLVNFIFDEAKSPHRNETRHSFYGLTEQKIQEAEKRMGFNFPKELREFYLEVGYGFLNKEGHTFFNRLMSPSDLVDFRLREDIYETDPDAEEYDNPNELVFFNTCEGCYLTIHLNEIGPDNKCPIYHFSEKIADSLEEFIFKMEEEANYYIEKINV